MPAPGRVNQIQETLGARLGEPVNLFMRCALTKDVTATVKGGAFTFTAPRDKEVAAWSDKLEAPFRKLAKK